MVSLEALLVLSALSVSVAGETVLLEFTAAGCIPCRTMEPTVSRLESAGYPVRRVNIEREQRLAARFGIQSVPCFVMLVDGREVDRVVGATSYARLSQMLSRTTGPETAPAQRVGSPLAEQPVADAGPMAGWPGQLHPPLDRSVSPPELPARNDSPAANPSDIQAAIVRARRASVRLMVEDPKGHSYGSGTIIDVHGSEALVLTCAHIFRDSGGRGRITVDVYQDDVPHSVTGQLVRHNLESDVALVAIRPAIRVTPVIVASPHHRLQKGETVFTMGCDHGARPSKMISRVTGINDVVGPASVQVAGKPVDGRSGGGLFTGDGLLVGVCNAAYVLENQGLYAGAGAVLSELDVAGLKFVYDNQRTGNRLVSDLSNQPPPLISPGQPVADTRSLSRATERKKDDDEPADKSATSKSIPDPLYDTEVICILRSRSNPGAKAEVIVLDKAPPELLKHLTLLKQQQAGPSPRYSEVVQRGGPAVTSTSGTADNAPVMRGQSPRF